MKTFIFTQLLRRLSSLPLQKGSLLTETRTVTQQNLDAFSEITGDRNPIHKKFGQQKNISLVHGAFLNGIVAGLIGTKLPGPGTVVLSQSFKFPNKCFTDIPIFIRIEVLEVRKIITIKYDCTQAENIVFEGEAKLIMNKDV